jgi:predicted nuclease of predicted toxin-antitoxin system
MSKSSYRLLLDENVERRAMRYLEKRSHDAEMVVDVVEPRATDDEVQQYAEETNRLVLTISSPVTIRLSFRRTTRCRRSRSPRLSMRLLKQ